jgi:SPP1 gp7 family putative phage head morphogenesis protein
MVRLMTKKKLTALENFAIIAKAKQAGLKIYRDDLYINYAEIENELTEIEDRTVEEAAKEFTASGRKWLEGIKNKEDLKSESLDIKSALSRILFSFIGDVWEYGQMRANEELEQMGIEQNWEFKRFADESRTGGTPSKVDEDQMNADALEWYELYVQKLSEKAEKDVFMYMQPLILEYIAEGMTGRKLSDALAADFARYGVVRADIIARTESTKAFNWGRRYRFDSSPALAGYRYSAIMDERTSPICRGLHGSSWEKGDPSLNGYTPPNHYRCRSILVPINKYSDFTFTPPDVGWTDDLSESEKTVLEKFTASGWYPVKEIASSRSLPDELQT